MTASPKFEPIPPDPTFPSTQTVQQQTPKLPPLNSGNHLRQSCNITNHQITKHPILIIIFWTHGKNDKKKRLKLNLHVWGRHQNFPFCATKGYTTAVAEWLLPCGEFGTDRCPWRAAHSAVWQKCSYMPLNSTG